MNWHELKMKVDKVLADEDEVWAFDLFSHHKIIHLNTQDDKIVVKEVLKYQTDAENIEACPQTSAEKEGEDDERS